MSPTHRMGVAFRRIASAVSAIRTRTCELERVSRDNGTNAELEARVEATASRLERVADDLENGLA